MDFGPVLFPVSGVSDTVHTELQTDGAGNEKELMSSSLVSMAPNQEPAVDCPASPRPPNPLPEPYPGVGKGVRISGLSFGLSFYARFCGLAPSAKNSHQKFAPNSHTHVENPRQNPHQKLRNKNPHTKIRTPHSQPKSSVNLPDDLYLQSPTASFQKVTRGAP